MLPNQAIQKMHSDDTGLNLGQASFPLELEYSRVLDSPLSDPLDRIPGMLREIRHVLSDPRKEIPHTPISALLSDA